MMKICRLFFALILARLLLNPSPAKANPVVDHLTVILIVDNSGSMETSDPEGLRFTGARLFAALLDPGDTLGLILFSTDSEPLTDRLVTLGSRSEVSSLLAGFSVPPADGFTDIKAAFEDVRRLLEAAEDPSEKIVIVLLTDGKPEIQNHYPQYEQETLELARSMNIPVMAIALTVAAQNPFLERLASVTNGTVIPANDVSDILNAYLQVLGQVKDRTVIGGDSFTTQTSLEIEPSLAPYVLSVTFVISKPEIASVHLFDPGGNDLAGEQGDDLRFSLLTLQSPASGEYSFQLQGGGRAKVWAILRTRLRIQILEPNNFHPPGRNMPIVVSLLEETLDGNFITINGETDFTALITSPDERQTSLDRFYDDGTHGDAVAGDGKYTRLFPNPALSGVYRISIQGWKDAIPLQTESQVTALKFPELIVDEPSEKVEVRGDAIILRAHLDNQSSFDQGEVMAQITLPSGLVHEIILQEKDGEFEGQFLPEENGPYRILFTTRGVKYLGVEYQTQVEGIFNVELIPTATVKLAGVKVSSSCVPSSNEYSLWLSITTTDVETLSFSASGWQVMPERMNLQKGDQKILLRLNPNQNEIGNASEVEMRVEGSGKLEIRPEPMIKAEFQIPGLYARCRTPIHAGVTILLILGGGIAALRRARIAALPPLVTGTLRYWETGGYSVLVEEIDLTAFEKHALLIGSGAACDVMIPHAELASDHAHITAERNAERTDVYLEPIGDVRKGYSAQNVRFVLRHGETFRMGAREFQYLSDRGE